MVNGVELIKQVIFYSLNHLKDLIYVIVGNNFNLNKNYKTRQLHPPKGGCLSPTTYS